MTKTHFWKHLLNEWVPLAHLWRLAHTFLLQGKWEAAASVYCAEALLVAGWS